MLRRLFTIVFIIAFWFTAGALYAQPRDVDLQNHQHDGQVARPPLVFVEPGPVMEATLYADGSVIEVQTEIVSRLICGSDPTGVTLEDLKRMVLSGREAFENDPNIVVISGPDGPRGPRSGIDIVFIAASPPPGAEAALDAAAAYLEGVFSDPVTVTITVSWADLSGNALGSTSNNYVTDVTWAVTRTGLILDMDCDDTIQSWLPSGATIPVRYNGSSGGVTNEGFCDFTLANFNAAVGSVGGYAASIQIDDTDYNWDYDPSNGVPGSYYCFQSVIVHEVGHALGFISRADYITNSKIEAMDIFRFQWTDGAGDYNPDTLAEFQTTARLVDFNNPNDDHITDLVSVEYRMSDGDPYQASHFRHIGDIGIMAPTTSPGETFYPDFFTQADIDVFDAIGWDYGGGGTATPFSDSFPSLVINPSLWPYADGVEINGDGDGEPSAPYSMNLSGTAGGGSEIYSICLDTSGLDGVQIDYYWQRTGNGDSPETNENLYVEYLDDTDTWIEVTFHPGAGPDDDPFVLASHDIFDPGALHTGFRVRFRNVSYQTGTFDDDWFVDDVFITSATDILAPSPAPTFATPPTPVSTTSLTMTSTVATDDTPPVEYYFWTSPFATPPGHIGDWQEDTTYIDTLLVPNTSYTYVVRARDSVIPVPNQTGFSIPDTASTYVETPSGIQDVSITETSIEVTALGTFTNPTEGDTGLYFSWELLDATPIGNSGWVATDATVTAGGLTAGTTYRFRVISRNRDGQTDPAGEATAEFTTDGAACACFGDLNTSNTVDGNDIALFVEMYLGTTPVDPCADFPPAGLPLDATDLADFVTRLLDGAPCP